jgi:peroxiredoxin
MLPKPWRQALLLIGVGLAAGLGGYGVARLMHPATPAATAPELTASKEFSLPDLAGKPHRLADYRGKLVLLNFWATWCPPCRREIPGFVRLQQHYGSQGLQIIGISVDNPEAVARFWQEMKINYPLLLADDSVYELMGAYGNRDAGLPYSVIIGRDGQAVATKLGAYEEKELEAQLKSLLARKNPG